MRTKSQHCSVEKVMATEVKRPEWPEMTHEQSRFGR
jgi:hypothetical protein